MSAPTVPTQRHPAEGLLNPREWVQHNFCPCGVRIEGNRQHCPNPACAAAHAEAEALLDLWTEVGDE